MKAFTLEVAGSGRWTGWNVLQVDGDFDPQAACELRERTLGLPETASIIVDLSHALHIQDAALDILADVIAGHIGGRVVVRGLTTHQERILQYFGIASTAFLGPSHVTHAA